MANDHAMMDNMAMENGMMSDPSNPYAQAEMKMNNAMTAAVGADVSDTWVKKTIEHHRGAVDMSNVLLSQSPTPEARAMAERTIAKQTRDIQDLQKLAKQGAADPASGEPYRAGGQQMHERMMAAKGADASEIWIRKMIEHHRGGVEMSNAVLANGATGEVRRMAEKTKADQTKEIGELERMLSGQPAPAGPVAAEPVTDAATGPVTKIAPVPPVQPKATPKPKAAPKVEPKATPPEKADPHAGHDMGNMSN
ncbi:MAG TPA: DUF305 domain-containing protein [Allosphingosinicella sp.]|nr:DUF305 domain-containing protein [Allosphingosinicella sp.]